MFDAQHASKVSAEEVYTTVELRVSVMYPPSF